MWNFSTDTCSIVKHSIQSGSQILSEIWWNIVGAGDWRNACCCSSDCDTFHVGPAKRLCLYPLTIFHRAVKENVHVICAPQLPCSFLSLWHCRISAYQQLQLWGILPSVVCRPPRCDCMSGNSFTMTKITLFSWLYTPKSSASDHKPQIHSFSHIYN